MKLQEESRGPMYFSPSFPHLKSLFVQYQNWEIDTSTMCVYNSTSFYHICRFAIVLQLRCRFILTDILLLLPLCSHIHSPFFPNDPYPLATTNLFTFFFFLIFIYLFIYLAVSGLCCGMQDLSCGTWASL